MDPEHPRGDFRPPKQSRSQETLDRIANAALTLMEERGVEGATVADIVDRADASVGSFYARFPAKEDLIRYLQVRVWTEARERWVAALEAESWEGHSLEAVVEGVVGLLVRSLRADYHRRKVLGRELPADPEASAQRLTFHHHILDTVTPLLLVRSEDITHPEPRKAIQFGYRFVVGAIREFLELEEGWHLLEATGSVPDERLGEGESGTGEGPLTEGALELGPELARMWMGYLAPGEEGRGQREEGAVDFFDPWG